MIDLKTRRQNKTLVWHYLHELDQATPNQTETILHKYHSEDAVWEIFHPFNTLRGCASAAKRFWRPLCQALPDMERRIDIFAGDLYQDHYWVTAMGYLCGNFVTPLLGIQPTGKLAYLRIGEFYKVVDQKITETHILLDIPDLMRQSGVYPFRPMPATPGLVPGPKQHNGLRQSDNDPEHSTLDTVLAMHKAIHAFDGQNLDSMPQTQFWSDHFHYYAPAGIGTTRGLASYKRNHQQPFLASFPDRRGTEHYCRISDGPIAATTHWGTLTATHTGSAWLNLPATGKKLTMRVADWYCANDRGLLHENWLMMDIPDILKQMGIDVFGSLTAFKA